MITPLSWSPEVPWVIGGALVYVANVDEHFAVAKRAGATILSEPKDDGRGRAGSSSCCGTPPMSPL